MAEQALEVVAKWTTAVDRGCSDAGRQRWPVAIRAQAKGISVDPTKIEVVRGWKQLTCVTEGRSFLGLAGYYQRFMEGFSKIAAPITKLIRKEVKFEWTAKCEDSFQELKDKLTSTPVLAMPSEPDGSVVYTDASKVGLGCVLMQHGRVIAYGSR
ncbi:uncharacterized mitochondrial protein AtMg00860-like [Diospyros lotus]|uniref:uncharacterized mitochondrial protein AtMg00860-like n=1 Tax=Diospyros lotus TaxID=55363 RepID=UPI0022581AD9|nr:uncharacterized mitochondrial protein AtMg00860-like [Diospyros lotus]